MPSINKKSLSLHFRTGCKRQLVLHLYGAGERRERGMPPLQDQRPGLGIVGKSGYDYQEKRVADLSLVFGENNLHWNPKKKEGRPGTVPLGEVLPGVTAHQFIIEAYYNANTQAFREALGVDRLLDSEGQSLEVGASNPDIIQVLPPNARHHTAPQTLDFKTDPLAQEVLPTGEVVHLSQADSRLRLRVIDIKQAAEPGAHYFAEVVYYSLTLASWLRQHNMDSRFVVVAAPAVWPGSYEASSIARAQDQAQRKQRSLLPAELAEALEEDLEIAPVDVFAPRLRSFFRETLPEVLSQPWEELPWHVSYQCNGCDFLGYPWRKSNGELMNDRLHCWPTAEQTGHLSRVAGLTKGSASLVRETARSVDDLARVSVDDAIFRASPTLRAKRTVFPHRAQALLSSTTGVIPDTGSDALMPRWPSLHIYIFLDYDLSSAITAAFSIRAHWKEPLPYLSLETPQQRRWAASPSDKSDEFQEVYPVSERDLTQERQEFLKFLRTLKEILTAVHDQDAKDVAEGRRGEPSKARRSSYQIYLWDEAQHKQLVRVVGRHLGAILADPKLRQLAWLFPPPELLQRPEEASYNSPLTLVSRILQNSIAAPVPHHYTLLEVVQTYHPSVVTAPTTHPLFREPLSDLLPGERIHEMWHKIGDWLETANTIKETCAKKLSALAYVVARLETDLKQVLNRSAAPEVLKEKARPRGLPPQSLLWYEYTRLNAALNELENHMTRSMPPHEREARFKSACLTRRLEGREKHKAYKALQEGAYQLPGVDQLLIYQMSEDSRDFNIRPPAIGFALAPRDDLTFLHSAAYPLAEGLNIRANLRGSISSAGLTNVSVEAIDRPRLLIALKPGYGNCIPDLERSRRVDLRSNVMLDPANPDFLSKKVRMTLQGIGCPPSARTDSRTLTALGIDKPSTSIESPECPASELLWQTQQLAELPARDRDLSSLQPTIEDHFGLNPSQLEAWKRALTHRLTLIWGPPGTGKSLTLRAIIAAALDCASTTGQPIRIAIASQTYAAVDNILLDLARSLPTILTKTPPVLFRLQSKSKRPSEELESLPHLKPVIISTNATDEVAQLQSLLSSGATTTVVASTSHQLHNLAVASRRPSDRNKAKRTQRPWFDLLIIDEASQLGVAEATLILSKAAPGASFVLAGDDKQLPPIYKAPPPQDLEHVVGSLYNYVRHQQCIEPTPLQVNYRASKTLVEFTKLAGYHPGLIAKHPDLRLAPLPQAPFPVEKPKAWPSNLFWTPEWTNFLKPERPAVAYIYQDETTGQANDFEADAIAALTWLLYGRIDRQLAGELGKNSTYLPLELTPRDSHDFWENGVGIVTPHKAQMGKIITRLQATFPDHNPSTIWNAVDTVERFQGQQRDVILASFGLGDPDIIRAEDEFLYDLNRFNVMASRARAKLIVFATSTLVEHLSNDADVLDASRLLKNFTGLFTDQSSRCTLGVIQGNAPEIVKGELRWRHADSGEHAGPTWAVSDA